NIKRLFAYSSVAQIGYMVIGMGIGSATGVQATLLHLFNHALMKGALFLALAAVVYRLGGANFSHIRGLGRTMPLTMAAIVVAGLSLVGVPGTVGFITKWYLVMAAINGSHWLLVPTILLGSLLALVYVWRIVEAAYFSEPVAGAETRREAPLGLLLAMWL